MAKTENIFVKPNLFRIIYVSLHKIGCGSAIKVNFIALTLHYLCLGL